MRKMFLNCTIAAILFSCSQVDSAKKSISIPQLPASVEAIQKRIKNKVYKAAEAGTISPFGDFEWASEATDTSKFFRDYMAERKEFILEFINDSIARLVDDKKSYEAKYRLEKDTSLAVLLNLSYVDSSFSFNPGEPALVTSTYKIRGADESHLFIETPRQLNRQNVIVIMQKK